MSEKLITLLGTIGGWVSGIAAHLIPIIIGFIYKRVSAKFPKLSPPILS